MSAIGMLGQRTASSPAVCTVMASPSMWPARKERRHAAVSRAFDFIRKQMEALQKSVLALTWRVDEIYAKPMGSAAMEGQRESEKQEARQEEGVEASEEGYELS